MCVVDLVNVFKEGCDGERCVCVIDEWCVKVWDVLDVECGWWGFCFVGG